MKKKSYLSAAALSMALVVAAPTAALAHSCLNASRSDTGSQNAAHGNWVYIPSEEIVGFIAFLAGVNPTGEDAAEFLAAVEEAGLPTSFSIFIGKHTIGANPTTHELVAAYEDGTKSADGKGIDHADELIPVYIGLMLSVVE